MDPQGPIFSRAFAVEHLGGVSIDDDKKTAPTEVCMMITIWSYLPLGYF